LGYKIMAEVNASNIEILKMATVLKIPLKQVQKAFLSSTD